MMPDQSSEQSSEQDDGQGDRQGGGQGEYLRFKEKNNDEKKSRVGDITSASFRSTECASIDRSIRSTDALS